MYRCTLQALSATSCMPTPHCPSSKPTADMVAQQHRLKGGGRNSLHPWGILWSVACGLVPDMAIT